MAIGLAFVKTVINVNGVDFSDAINKHVNVYVVCDCNKTASSWNRFFRLCDHMIVWTELHHPVIRSDNMLHQCTHAGAFHPEQHSPTTPKLHELSSALKSEHSSYKSREPLATAGDKADKTVFVLLALSTGSGKAARDGHVLPLNCTKQAKSEYCASPQNSIAKRSPRRRSTW